ncbi:MAG: 30S ribosomal protein S6 [Armatimonadota bacterium]
MREYELIYIIDPDLEEEAVVATIDRFTQLATNQGAEVVNVERWEKRKLAYEIKDKREGIYVVMNLRAQPAAIAEVERVLKLSDAILRHMTIRKDGK